MTHVVFDCELIGSTKPVFLVCTKELETGTTNAFWFHKRGHMKQLTKMLLNPGYTWVGFNSYKFDIPLVAAATCGVEPVILKEMAQKIIDENIQPWMLPKMFGFEELELDHIDLIETAPGVMISLKTYAGRMGVKTMIDMPFEHDQDLTPKQHKIVETYCFNDIAVTEELFKRLKTEIALRVDLGERYGLELRSKSDAQVAEAILKSQCNLGRKDKIVPTSVDYTCPDFIETTNEQINSIIEELETTRFKINRANGSPEVPEFLKETIRLGYGNYQMGIGGLHSTHDTKLYVRAHGTKRISDFDARAYYPTLLIRAGYVPRFGGNKGEVFLAEYKKIYDERNAAKEAGIKKVANSLKTVCNGTFGKLGSIYSAFYSPDLMLAVTITGQINLLTLIVELETIKGVRVISANTDGLMVEYDEKYYKRILKVFEKNSKRTGFEYEETPYRCVAMKDVNNYIAVTTDNKIKSKGLYASVNPEENPLYLMKNPTMEVCSLACRLYLLDGTLPEVTVYSDVRKIEEFVAIRNVKGGGVQHEHYETVDDWELAEDHGSAQNVWVSPRSLKQVKRKSRPAPYEQGVGGTPFGRVARWYMTLDKLPPITYVGSGNMVPKTEGARICMTLPDELPPDLDKNWYVQEAYNMLNDMGVAL